MKLNRTAAFAATLATALLMGAGCPESDSSLAIPAGGAYGESVLGAPNAEEVRANADAFRQRQNQPINTLDENGNSTAAVPEGGSQGDTTMQDGPQPQPSEPDTSDSSSETTMQRPTSFPGVLPADQITGKQVRLVTTKGEIVFELLGNEGPKAASNFVVLAQTGYYDGLIFHRVVPGFVIQGGDPTGTGTGGPGYKFEDDEVKIPYKAGIVAMANAGPDTNGSQFFIVLEDQPSLPPSYSVFGRVTQGMDVVRQIAKGDKMTKVTVEAFN